MYLDELHIHRLKLLRDFKLKFTRPDGSPRMWTAIIGENGTAKTSILQAIALAAVGSAQVNRLAAPIVGHLRDRRDEAPLSITATFRFSEMHRRFKELHPVLGRPLAVGERLGSHLTLARDASTIFGRASYASEIGGTADPLPASGAGMDELRPAAAADPLDVARSQNLPLWFVAAYGVSRFLPDPNQAPLLDNPAVERLEALFRNTISLTSLRFIDHFAEEKARAFVKLLSETLTRANGLVPGLEGINLTGRGGVVRAGQLIEKDRFRLRLGGPTINIPAVALSHGYQSTIAWIADLIGHVMLEAGSKPVEADEIEGMVLVDEIDLYLHPTWQAGLLDALRHTFPKVQFVVTTHSPVLLASLAPDEIVRVGHHPETGDVEEFVHHPESGDLVPLSSLERRPEPVLDPRTMTGTEVYRDWFGVDRLTLNRHGERIRRYQSLASDPFRSDEEDAAMVALAVELGRAGVGELPPPAPRKVS